MLTVLTPEHGKLSVAAKGALRRGSRIGAAAQLMACGEMTLCEGSGGIWTLTEAPAPELFLALREDPVGLSLGSYVLQLLEELSDMDVPDAELMSLGCNALWALSRKLYPQELIKAALELRLMCAAGFAPALDACAVCGREPTGTRFLYSGGICCRDCASQAEGRRDPVSPGVLAAMRYVCSCPSKRLYAFHLDERSVAELGKITETYLRMQTEREFSALQMYDAFRKMQ